MKKLLSLLIPIIFLFSCDKGKIKDDEVIIYNNGATISGLLVKEIRKIEKGPDINIDYYYNTDNRLSKRISNSNGKVGNTDIRTEITYDIVYNTDITVKNIRKQQSQFSTDKWLNNSFIYDYSFTYDNGSLLSAAIKQYESKTNQWSSAAQYKFEMTNGLISKITSVRNPSDVTFIDYESDVIKETFISGRSGRSIYFSNKKGALYESYINQFLIVDIDEQDFILLSKNDVTQYSGSWADIGIGTKYNDYGKPVEKNYPGKDKDLNNINITTNYYYSK